MNRFKLLLCLLLGGPIFLSKPVKAQSNTLPEFTKIVIEGSVKVELIIADRHSIYLGENNKVQSQVKGDALNISGAPTNSEPIKVYAQHINMIEMNGAGTIVCNDTITSDLMINLNGASKAKFILVSQKISVDLDGATKLELAGTSNNLSVSNNGASRLSAQDLKTHYVTIKSDGASTSNIYVDSAINAKSTGMSTINFAGNPSIKNLSIDGMSRIKSLTNDEVFDSKNFDGTNENDTTKIQFRNKKVLIFGDENKVEKPKSTRMKSVYGGIEVGMNGFFTPDFNRFNGDYKFLNNKIGNSWTLGFNLPEINGHIIKNKLAIITALGIQGNHIRIDGDNYFTPNSDTLGYTTSPDALSKNKLYTFNFNVPVILKFAPGTAKKTEGGFHIAAGVIGRYSPIAVVKTETTAKGYDQNVELRDDFNINTFRLDGTVRIGYDRIKLFVNYGLTPYFTKGPDVRSVMAGITLIGF